MHMLSEGMALYDMLQLSDMTNTELTWRDGCLCVRVAIELAALCICAATCSLHAFSGCVSYSLYLC